MIAFILLLAISIASFSQGHLYEIAEPDALEELEAKKEEVLKKLRERLRQIKEKLRQKPEWAFSLPPAQWDSTYRVNLDYELPVDIPRVDRNGNVIGVLYPAGFVFNPLKQLTVDPPVLIVFNGSRKEEIERVKQIKDKYFYRMFIITDGDPISIMQELSEKVYFLTEQMATRLDLRATISVVTWDRKNGEAIVEVIHVPPKGN